MNQQSQFGRPTRIIDESLDIEESKITIKGILIEAESLLSEIDPAHELSISELDKLADIRSQLLRANIHAEKHELDSLKKEIMKLIRRIQEIQE